MLQKIASFLFCIFLLLPTACSKQLPDQMPDLGINIDELEFNTYIKLTAPKELNEYKSGKSVRLEVENISKQEWELSITKDILIYQYEDKEWKKVSDRMIHTGATDLTLSPKGEFPLDRDVLGVIPDVEPDTSSDLRIILIVHKPTGEQVTRSKGAFVDVALKP